MPTFALRYALAAALAAGSSAFARAQEKTYGVVVYGGTSTHGNAIGPFIGDGYLHDGDDDKGGRRLIFAAKLPKAGDYEVRLAYSPNANRATNVPIVVQHAGGESKIVVNQQQTPAIDKLFTSLGKFKFDAENSAVVEISNEDTNGHVIVDAVQLIPVQ